MKRKYTLKAGILLAILLLILPVSVESAQAALSIGPITGGIGVKTTISSTTTETNVQWTIQINGGWIFNYRTRTGLIVSIDPSTPVQIMALPIGFGGIAGINPITITVTTIPPATPPPPPPVPTRLLFILVW